MKRISTHILDVALGKPAKDVPVRLERQESAGEWRVLSLLRTDSDGRCPELLPENETLRAGTYRVAFDTASYHRGQQIEGLYPVIEITFQVRDGESHFHIPLLLSPHGYTTYREADSMITLAENSYGKSRVRLAKVKRHPDRHDFCEWTIEILLEGDFENCFVAGDNSRILPTDTMKNTVYSLARTSSAECMEEFGKELVTFLLDRNPQVSAARVTLSEKSWQHLHTNGKPHPKTFVQSSNECQTAEIAASPNTTPSVRSGLENLIILKTAGSEFTGFIKDSLTTLPEASDRLLGTSVRARWNYSSPNLPFPALRSKIREILLNVFAAHSSKSVQHTLYAMGEAALADVPQIDDIELTMPNKHYLLADLSRFGQDNPNEIFAPIDEPHGTIEARLRRQG